MKQTEQKVIRFIDENRLIEKKDNILIALSGGPDSVFLLHFLIKYKKRFNITIAAFHLNHMLRGNEANEDEKFCKEICADLKIKFFNARKRVNNYAKKNKLSVEIAGRTLRYIELERIAKKYGYNKIATGHNLNDNTETVLLNLIKGAGLRGLSGIPLKRGNIIRPVLVLEKEEIINYLNKNKIPFRIDPSNTSIVYERNFLRNEVIPLLKTELNPSLDRSVLKTASVVRAANEFIKKKIPELSKEIISDNGGQLFVNVEKLLLLDEELYGEILKTAIDKYFIFQTSSDEIKRIVSLLNVQSGKQIKLSKELTAVRERDRIFIGKNIFPDEMTGSYKLKPGKSLLVDNKKISIKNISSYNQSLKKKRNEEIISADNLSDTFWIRRWKPGDRFYPLGMKGSKKVSDFLTEKKISSIIKRNQLVLINDDKVVWVVGLRIDDRFKVTTETKRIYRLCLS